jgi:hypothetical protein
MRSRDVILIIAFAIFLLTVAGVYLFVGRPRPASVKPPSDVIEEIPAPETGERNAVLNLYLHAPLPLAGIARMEMTLTGLEAVDEAGAVHAVSEDARRMTLQHGIVQKIANARVPAGRIERLILTFGPTARITADDRTVQTVFLPERTLAVDIKDDAPLSGTMNVLIALPRNTAFGEDGGVLTLELPASTASDRANLGGFFLNERSIGEVYAIADATIRDVILADIGLDITPREGARGSTGFDAPDEAQPPPPDGP